MSHLNSKLFQPIRVGDIQLSHRVVLAPLTRIRADDEYAPTYTMTDYYAQRASVKGSLLIAEGTIIAPRATGLNNVPGIWSDEQVKGWKKVTDAIHEQGSFIYLQLYAFGRAAYPDMLAKPDSNQGGPYPYVSSSGLPLSDRLGAPSPRPLSHEEILEYIELFGQAAHNSVHRAGFDGVEVHCANGYLIDEFIQDVSNKRTDKWGGSIENRTRFALEAIKKVTSVIGEERTGIRLSPYSTFQDMRMEHPQPTFAYLVSRVREAYPRFAYLHVVEPRIAGALDRIALTGESNDFLRAIWKGPDSERNGSVYIKAGGYTAESALADAEESGDLIAFGRYYISNPDLPARIKNGIQFAPYNRDKFYTGGTVGYSDYPFADAESEANHKVWCARGIEANAQVSRIR